MNGLISRAESVYLIPWGKVVSRGRELATLLVDGRDIAICATHEKWAVDYMLRDAIDWGDPALPFPDIRLPRTLGAILS